MKKTIHNTLEEVPEEMVYELTNLIGKYTTDLTLSVDESSKTLLKKGHNGMVKIRYSIIDDAPVVIYVEETIFI